MTRRRVLALLLAPLAALGLAGGALAERARLPYETVMGGFAREALELHNGERRALGVPPLSWSPRLAEEARQWAERLAREGAMYHASQEESGDAGENLWMGTAGYFPLESMIGAFLEEKRHYRHAVFPDVSRTGRWEDVGHYTQIVWRDTREVGCAVTRGARYEFLVCRYWPAGNWIGETAY